MQHSRIGMKHGKHHGILHSEHCMNGSDRNVAIFTGNVNRYSIARIGIQNANHHGIVDRKHCMNGRDTDIAVSVEILEE